MPQAPPAPDSALLASKQDLPIKPVKPPFAIPRPAFVDVAAEKLRVFGIWGGFLFLIFIVLAVKLMTMRQLADGPVFGAYSILVTTFILSRFLLAYLHVPVTPDESYRPTVSFVIPCKNEGANIERTMLGLLAVGYPTYLMDLCVINDGSTDDTLEQMQQAAEVTNSGGLETHVIDWKVNRGKREGMAEGIAATKGDIIILVDSDSFLDRGSVQRMVGLFRDPTIAAVTGHARVYNRDTNLLTKMQHVRYYIAFRVYKAAEALFGSVTCCSGCCSAYRRNSLEKVLDHWRRQTFLGVPCTYGDDRSLTNHLLRLGYRTVFAPDAMSSTIVPDSWRVFLRQQLRWKKSWIRESLIAATFMWKRHPVMSAGFYAGLILPLLSPAVIFRSLLYIPVVMHRIPAAYLFGVGVMALIYGLFYFVNTRERDWLFGLLFAAFSTIILVWQLPIAMITLRDGSWGTR